MKFQSCVERGGKTATGIPVPEEVVEALGGGKRPKVTVTIGDYTYRNSIASMDGRYMISLSGEHRERAGLSAGDLIEVNVELDTEVREVEVPSDLQDALEQVPAANEQFQRLSYSGKLRYVLPVQDAKTDETRRRRIAKVIESLNAS